MKSRNGFVSNSSSSSFYIYGSLISRDPRDLREEVKEKLFSAWKEQTKKSNEAYRLRNPDSTWLPQDPETYTMEDFLHEDDYGDRLATALDLEYHSGYEDAYLGEDPANWPDDALIGDAKKAVAEKLKGVWKQDPQVGWQEECFYS